MLTIVMSSEKCFQMKSINFLEFFHLIFKLGGQGRIFFDFFCWKNLNHFFIQIIAMTVFVEKYSDDPIIAMDKDNNMCQ